MISNARITGWRMATGATAAGVPTFADQVIASPAPALHSGLTLQQQAMLATTSIQATGTVIHQVDRTGAPNVAVGDRIQLDRSVDWLDVVSLGATVKGAVSHRLLYVKKPGTP